MNTLDINSPESISPTQKQQQNKIGKFNIIFIILLIISFGLNGYFGYMYFNSSKENLAENNQVIQKAENTETKQTIKEILRRFREDTRAIDQEKIKIRKAFVKKMDGLVLKIESNEIEYQTSEYQGDLSFYDSEEIQLPFLNRYKNVIPFMSTRISEYSPGLVYRVGYEGISQDIEMDKEVDFLKSLVEGTHKMTVYSSNVIDIIKPDASVNVTAKKIGRLIFRVNDYYFKPSGSTIRSYKAYDQDSMRIIQFNLVDIEGEYNNGEIQYSVSMLVLLDEIEEYLEKL